VYCVYKYVHLSVNSSYVCLCRSTLSSCTLRIFLPCSTKFTIATGYSVMLTTSKGRGQRIRYLLYCFQFNTPPHVSKYMKTMCGGGGGVESCWRPYSTGVLHYECDQIQNLQNCLSTPRKKPRKGEGLKQINSCRKVLLQVTFNAKRFCIAYCESYPFLVLTFALLFL
jgi:hypothetical protein